MQRDADRSGRGDRVRAGVPVGNVARRIVLCDVIAARLEIHREAAVVAGERRRRGGDAVQQLRGDLNASDRPAGALVVQVPCDPPSFLQHEVRVGHFRPDTDRDLVGVEVTVLSAVELPREPSRQVLAQPQLVTVGRQAVYPVAAVRLRGPTDAFEVTDRGIRDDAHRGDGCGSIAGVHVAGYRSCRFQTDVDRLGCGGRRNRHVRRNIPPVDIVVVARTRVACPFGVHLVLAERQPGQYVAAVSSSRRREAFVEEVQTGTRADPRARYRRRAVALIDVAGNAAALVQIEI